MVENVLGAGAKAPAPARIGIGGPVGSGKTALLEKLIPSLIQRGLQLAVITNDLVTTEDAERLKNRGLLSSDRIKAVETGACPHTAIREDPTLNIETADQLEHTFSGKLDVILIESGGDNLASTFSLDLVDYWMFVIDVAEGADIPRKRGPGIVQCDLLVINKIDLASQVGVDTSRLVEDAQKVRKGKPISLTNCSTGQGVESIVDQLSQDVLFDSATSDV